MIPSLFLASAELGKRICEWQAYSRQRASFCPLISSESPSETWAGSVLAFPFRAQSPNHHVLVPFCLLVLSSVSLSSLAFYCKQQEETGPSLWQFAWKSPQLNLQVHCPQALPPMQSQVPLRWALPLSVTDSRHWYLFPHRSRHPPAIQTFCSASHFFLSPPWLGLWRPHFYQPVSGSPGLFDDRVRSSSYTVRLLVQQCPTCRHWNLYFSWSNRPGGLKQQTFVLVCFWRSVVWNPFHSAE